MDVINYFEENEYISIHDKHGSIFTFKIIGIENIDKYKIKLNMELFNENKIIKPIKVDRPKLQMFTESLRLITCNRKNCVQYS